MTNIWKGVIFESKTGLCTNLTGYDSKTGQKSTFQFQVFGSLKLSSSISKFSTPIFDPFNVEGWICKKVSFLNPKRAFLQIPKDISQKQHKNPHSGFKHSIPWRFLVLWTSFRTRFWIRLVWSHAYVRRCHFLSKKEPFYKFNEA